ncbi:MAG: hypothetical protein SF028_14045 [Candidatus Sumerlaeia bacterium]|nr:hypothetical protein [Candidatus Sumerlaeia bacterium]
MGHGAEQLLDANLELLQRMIEQQRAKVLKIARQINPRITNDDIMNPFDWPEVSNNPQFSFEDGLLAGLISADAALRAQARDAGMFPAPFKDTPP